MSASRADVSWRRALITRIATGFYAASPQQESDMPGKRPDEPIAPATIPGKPTDPKIPPDQQPEVTPLDEDEHIDEGIEVKET